MVPTVVKLPLYCPFQLAVLLKLALLTPVDDKQLSTRYSIVYPVIPLVLIGSDQLIERPDGA